MQRVLALALLAAACATTPTRALTLIPEAPTAHGDFDGDGRADTANFFETDEGVLIVGIQRAATPAPDEVWGGDISSLPRFTFRTAPPGRYETDCEAYGPNCGGEPPTRTLTHDGIIVEGLEDHSRTLYFWSDGAFKNVSIREPRP